MLFFFFVGHDFDLLTSERVYVNNNLALEDKEC